MSIELQAADQASTAASAWRWLRRPARSAVRSSASHPAHSAPRPRPPARADRPRTARAPGRARPGRSAAARRASRRTRPRRRRPSRAASSGATPRLRRRAPLRAVAPTITGRATVRESRFACSRVKRRAAGGGEGRAVAGDARDQRGGLGEPEREPVDHARVAGAALLRPGVGGEHRGRPGDEPGGDRPRAAEVSLDLALERVADDRRGDEREPDHRGSARVEGGELGRDLAPLADQQRRRGAGVQRDLEALARLRVDLLPAPAGEPGEEREVRGARDRAAARSGPGSSRGPPRERG